MTPDLLLDLGHALTGLYVFAVAIGVLIISACCKAMRRGE